MRYRVFLNVKGGIEKLNKVLLPLLIVIMIIIVIRGVTLEGEIGRASCRERV